MDDAVIAGFERRRASVIEATRLVEARASPFTDATVRVLAIARWKGQIR
jgi:hypothetical protein